MDPQIQQSSVWALVRAQHGVISRAQLLALGLSRDAIKHRVARGRLHPIWRGVYAVGRPELTRHGWWMAAVLACGPGAALSHSSAAALWEILPYKTGVIHVSVLETDRNRLGIVIHRRSRSTLGDVVLRQGIPTTSVAATMIDLATEVHGDELETAINAADKRDLIDPEALRRTLEVARGQPGVAILRRLLDRRTFTLTDSQLERSFLPIARKAGLPRPRTREWVNGFRVDFHWPELGLVVETDGLRYHRTPAQQATDRVRDQIHTARGLTPLRFTRAQVVFEPQHVEAVLAAVARRLAAAT